MEKQEKKKFHINKQTLKVQIACVLAVTLIMTAVIFIYSLRSENNEGKPTGTDVSSTVSSAVTFAEMKTAKVFNENLKIATVQAGVDFGTKSSDNEAIYAEIDSLLFDIKEDNFNTVNVTTEFGEEKLNWLKYIYEKGVEVGLNIFCTVDYSGYTANFENKVADNLLPYCDTLIFDNISKCEADGISAENFEKDFLDTYESIYKFSPSIPIGVLLSSDLSDGIEKSIIDKDIADFYIIDNYCEIEAAPSFESVLNFYVENYAERKLYFRLFPSLIGEKEGCFAEHDQLLKQLMMLFDKGINEFCFDSYSAFSDDETGSTKAIRKFLSGQMSEDYVCKELTITSPSKLSSTVDTETVALIGASDPEFSVTLDGKELERNEMGYFSLDLSLKDGTNTFVLEHKGVTKKLKITYKRTIIKDVSPSKVQDLIGGSSLSVNVVALKNSTATATLDGEKISLTEYAIEDSIFSNYVGLFTVPINYDESVSLGKISFEVKSPYGTATKKSAEIKVQKSERPIDPDDPPLPLGGEYIDVGTKYIAEVVSYQAETFNAKDTADYSRPTNNYLPEGTVDYCSEYTYTSGKEVLRTLRYGKMVYTEHDDVTNIKIYKGDLPNHNEINLAGYVEAGRHTQMIFDVDWKAPFKFDLLQQKYTTQSEVGGNRDYTISSATYSYVDITFCYATVFTGEFDLTNNPIFERAEWIKNESDCTLRLFLRRVGQFYGWSAEYNSDGQLVFSFLNPAKIQSADNSYGYLLDGVVVAIDVGHGGSDPGAVSGKVTEAALNLKLALKLKEELESIGAKVILNRSDNSSLTPAQRILYLKNEKPDFMIAIHRNSSSSSTPRGFNTFHFNALSSAAAKYVNTAVTNADLYKVTKWSGLKWHYYYALRPFTDCPAILTENGYMSNASELAQITNDQFNTDCAVAMTRGIVDYFISIQQ